MTESRTTRSATAPAAVPVRRRGRRARAWRAHPRSLSRHGDEAFLAGHFPATRCSRACCSSRRWRRPARSRCSRTRVTGQPAAVRRGRRVSLPPHRAAGRRARARGRDGAAQRAGGWGRAVASVDGQDAAAPGCSSRSPGDVGLGVSGDRLLLFSPAGAAPGARRREVRRRWSAGGPAGSWVSGSDRAGAWSRRHAGSGLSARTRRERGEHDHEQAPTEAPAMSPQRTATMPHRTGGIMPGLA